MSFTEAIKLLPGFRFRPTDEELVGYYLKRKVLGRVFPFEVIAQVELYKHEPWDLPEESALRTKDLEWYFFIPRDKKYPNGSRTNRATVKGYWKSTGKDRPVPSSSRVVGTKKTLVYYTGRAPKGERTNWVMHEYRLNDVECQRMHAVENGFVLCRVYQKSGVGPKNGEQYGAPVADDDFEDSPTVQVDGRGSLKLELSARESTSPNTFLGESFTAQHGNDCISSGIDMIGQQLPGSDLEPCDPSIHFEKFNGSFEQNNVQNVTGLVFGDAVLAGNGELVKPMVAALLTSEDEAEMLEQLLDECMDELKSTDEYQNKSMVLDAGCYLTGTHDHSDGAFLELNDLAPVSNCEGETSVKINENNAALGFKDLADEAQRFLMQAPPTFGAWKNLPSGDAHCEGEQIMPEVMEMQSTSSTVSYDSQQQPFRKNMFGHCPRHLACHNENIGLAGPTHPIEPGEENGSETLNHLNAHVSEKDYFEKVLESEGNPEISLQEGGYFDATPLFFNIDEFEESTNPNLEGYNDDGVPQVTFSSSQWANRVDESLDAVASKAKDDGDSSQDQDVCLESGMHSPRSLSLLLRFINSFPTLPASAAELSPKATSPGGSVHVTAAGVAMGSVSVTCTCMGESVPSSCASSVTEAENKGQLVHSISFIGQRKKPLNRWDMGMLRWAVFGCLLAFFGVLAMAGTWKLLEGTCKLTLSSKT